jgi:DNA-binding transcriptional regulator YhcF (GntR family)
VQRIPSIRETAEISQMNPNTVFRANEQPEKMAIIGNQRDMDHFLFQCAPKVMRKLKRESFELPRIYWIMQRLTIGIDDMWALIEGRQGASGEEKAS